MEPILFVLGLFGLVNANCNLITKRQFKTALPFPYGGTDYNLILQSFLFLNLFTSTIDNLQILKSMTKYGKK